jgi:hypothetical protein
MIYITSNIKMQVSNLGVACGCWDSSQGRSYSLDVHSSHIECQLVTRMGWIPNCSSSFE